MEVTISSTVFKKLTDFSYVRSTKEAVGFYFAYFIMAVLIGALLGATSALLFPKEDLMQLGIRVGNVIAILIASLLAIANLSKKRLTGEYKYIMIALLAGLLAVFGGSLLGLIPVAYLTTVKAKK